MEGGRRLGGAAAPLGEVHGAGGHEQKLECRSCGTVAELDAYEAACR